MNQPRQSRNESYINATPSVCPECHRLVSAQIIDRDGKVFMKKYCPDHGHVEVLISGDADWYRRTSAIKFTPQLPREFTSRVKDGCPNDCGICGDHQQRCMIPVVEVTDHCNMTCPICFAHNRNRYHMSGDELERCLDAVQKSEGTDVDLLVVSGGEPTIHPEFFGLMERAIARGFKNITVNTNGIRLARDEEFCARAKELGFAFTMWMDGFRSSTYEALRGKDVRDMKEAALANLEKHDINTNLLAVVARGVNEDEVGEVLRFGLGKRFVRSVNYHTMSFTGSRGASFPHDADGITTLPDIMKLIEAQVGFLEMSDFSPIAAPHPLCESNTYLLMARDGDPIPVPRLMEEGAYPAVFENVAVLRPDGQLRDRLRAVIDYLHTRPRGDETASRAHAFFRDLMGRCFPESGSITDAERARICEDAIKAVFLIPYMDAYNLDIARLRGCVAMQALPDGRLIPSCSYFPIHRYTDERFFPREDAAADA